MESSVEFERLLASGKISGLSSLESDSKLAHAAGAIADFSPIGDAVDCPFINIATALAFVAKINANDGSELDQLNSGRPDANQAAAAILSSVGDALPPTKALLARIAMLRAFNRRARVALPWLSLRPAQEGSAILGGLCGYGASIERAGRSKDSYASTTVRNSLVFSCMFRFKGRYAHPTFLLFLDSNGYKHRRLRQEFDNAAASSLQA
jgi:hypothetical protein